MSTPASAREARTAEAGASDRAAAAPDPPDAVLCRRGVFDLAARRQAFTSGATVAVTANGEEFWRWFTALVRYDEPASFQILDDDTEYPPASNGPALWFSGGVESTYTRVRLAEQGLRPTLLRIEDYPVFTGPDRNIGQIHFICAAVAASLGYGPIFLGMERNDLLLGANAFMGRYVERHPVFAERWSAYQPEHPVLTVCADLHKEEMIRWLHQRSVPITGTCDRLSGGAWCGTCYKCFEAFYSAKAVGIDLGIPLARSGFDIYYGEYRRYLDSGFKDNFNNAYQHYVRLQISYGVTFDPELDCREGI